MSDVVKHLENHEVDENRQDCRRRIPEHYHRWHPTEWEDNAERDGADQDPRPSFAHATFGAIGPLTDQWIGDYVENFHERLPEGEPQGIHRESGRVEEEHVLTDHILDEVVGPIKGAVGDSLLNRHNGMVGLVHAAGHRVIRSSMEDRGAQFNRDENV